MPTYTQEGRPMRVDFEGVAEDVLLLRAFSGVEELSRPFAFDVELLSEEDALQSDDVLRKWALLTLITPAGEKRFIHGIVNRFVQLDQKDDLTSYRATLVPWFWFLSLSHDCKVFQNKSVLEIADEVFGELGYADYRFNCTRSYDPREYCVQYRESHLDFVSRLFEEEGISFYFEHSDSGHQMVICDANSAFEPCPGQSDARMVPEMSPEEDGVLSLRHERAVHVGKVTLSAFDYLQPSLKLESSISGADGEEVYDYSGGFTKPEQGDHYARLRLEAHELLEKTVAGESTCRAFATGYRFDLQEHYRDDLNESYTLIQLAHQGWAGDYRSWEDTPADYRNTFVAAPHSVPFRPQLVTRKPVVQGSQTATVVGKSGEEVWVDKHGRIKVQFHWDRLGGRDENSSCWVRVATPWGGKAWGSVSIPRIGNEVIVDFLEGDPDRPIIVGSVYNAEQTPPFVGIQMGMKSRSSKGGGGYNEITLTDTKGEELITIHGQYDMDTTIEHDRREAIGNDESLSVGNDQSITVGNNRTEAVGTDEEVSIGSNRTETVGADETLSVGGSRSRSVALNEDVTVGVAQEVSIGAARNLTVGASHNVDVGANQSVDVGGSESVSVGKNRSVEIGDSDSLKVKKNLVIDAGDSVSIKTGKASITMKKDGTIVLKGKDISIKASGTVNVKASKDIILKGKKILQN